MAINGTSMDGLLHMLPTVESTTSDSEMHYDQLMTAEQMRMLLDCEIAVLIIVFTMAVVCKT